MRKFITTLGLAAIIATAGFGFTASEAHAKKHHHHGHHGHHGYYWGFGGLASGLALGYALSQPSQPTVVYQPYPGYTYYGCNPYNAYVPCYAPAYVPVQ